MREFDKRNTVNIMNKEIGNDIVGTFVFVKIPDFKAHEDTDDMDMNSFKISARQ